ncbi:YHYH domain-containing protein [Vibrio campbellii]|nr:YHYH domain-containing protein [Vibrio campbellii]
MKNVIAIISLALAFSLPVMAHSGGTDSNGCHTDHSTGTRHCH